MTKQTPDSAPELHASEAQQNAVDRRRFLGHLGGLAAGVTAAGGLSVLPALVSAPGASAAADEDGGPLSAKKRRTKAYNLRHKIAKNNRKQPIVKAHGNGDEQLYPDRIGNYHKGLPHDADGVVDPAAYDALLHAISKGKPALFEAIPMGVSDPLLRYPLKNPQSGLAFDLEGLDVCQFDLPAAPALASPEAAGEMVELYWMARLRDVAFTDYATDAGVAAACAELSLLSDFRGPKVGGAVTPDTLFREGTAGSMVGPWLSQYLLRAVPFGAVQVSQQLRTVIAGDDHVTDLATWLAIQNGAKPTAVQTFDPVRRFVRNGRDIAQWVHADVLYQAYFHAALILMTPEDAGDPFTGGGLGTPLNPGNPYTNSLTQCGFGTFGPPHIAGLLAEVSTRALKAVWFAKWFIQRRHRPEAYGQLVHRAKNGALLPLHEDVLNASVLADIHTTHGTYLLPQAFPEASPLHPSYGSGHATVAGACITVLKAMFDGSAPVPNPVVAASDGLSLVPYIGPDAGSLTVAGELEKLASNIAHARNIAGIHWRSDASNSMRLGEQVAISVLQDQRKTYNEDFDGLTFTTFDGETITV